MVAAPDPLLVPPPHRAARPIPHWLATALQRAHFAELHAVGDERRPAFALTRALLGGARRAGYSASRLAECVNVSVSSIRTRSGSDGWIAADTFREIAGIDTDTVNRLQASGLLPTTTLDHTGQRCYLASELIRALNAD